MINKTPKIYKVSIQMYIITNGIENKLIRYLKQY